MSPDPNRLSTHQIQAEELRRPVFFAGIFAICIVNAMSQPVMKALATDGVVKSIYTLFGFSPIVVFALVIGFWKLLAIDSGTEVGKLDIAVAATAILLSFVPWYLASWIGVSLLAVHGIAGNGSDSRFRAAIMIFLTMTFPLLWGPAFLKLIGPVVLEMETSVIAAIFGLKSVGNTFISSTDSSSLTVFWPCSSFHSISLAFVGWTAFAALFDHKTSRRDIPIISLAVLGVFIVNAVRLVAMALFPSHFQELHYGYGADLTNLATVVIIATVGFYGCRSA